MKCNEVEELISLYIEGELQKEEAKEISLHLEQCHQCTRLKKTLEDMMEVFPELEEEVPFFLKNRLYYIPESQQVIELPQNRFYLLKWVAAAIGTFVLFLNLFYFTNIYPAANRFLHTAVAKIETFTVETGAFFERLKESKDLMVFSFFTNEDDEDSYKEFDETVEAGADSEAETQTNQESKSDADNVEKINRNKRSGDTAQTDNKKDSNEKSKLSPEQELLKKIKADLEKERNKKNNKKPVEKKGNQKGNLKENQDKGYKPNKEDKQEK
jgi:hypothetical protein